MTNSLPLARLETRTVPDLLERSGCFGLDRPWVIESSTGKSLHYGEFLERTARTAQKLSQRFQPGAHIAVMLSNHLEFFIVRFAISCAGLVEISLNGEQKGTVLLGMLETAKPVGFIVDQQYLENLTGCGFDLSCKEMIIGDEIVTLCAERAGWESRPQIDIAPADTCRILFTSGTTGVSKGVVLSHAYEVFTGHGWGRVLGLAPEDRFLYTTRLFHADAQGLIGAFLHHGASCVITDRFSASRFWSIAVRYEATCFLHVGTILAILNRGEKHQPITKSDLPLGPDARKDYGSNGPSAPASPCSKDLVCRSVLSAVLPHVTPRFPAPRENRYSGLKWLSSIRWIGRSNPAPVVKLCCVRQSRSR